MKENRDRDSVRLTQIQHWIIRYLDKNQDKDIFQKDLEKEFHASRAAISGTLQVMERNGLIERHAMEWDARLKKISLTEKALEFSRHARENVDRTEKLLRKGMTPEESETLLRLLRQVRSNLEEMRSAELSYGLKREELQQDPPSVPAGEQAQSRPPESAEQA